MGGRGVRARRLADRADHFAHVGLSRRAPPRTPGAPTTPRGVGGCELHSGAGPPLTRPGVPIAWGGVGCVLAAWWPERSTSPTLDFLAARPLGPPGPRPRREGSEGAKSVVARALPRPVRGCPSHVGPVAKCLAAWRPERSTSPTLHFRTARPLGPPGPRPRPEGSEGAKSYYALLNFVLLTNVTHGPTLLRQRERTISNALNL